MARPKCGQSTNGHVWPHTPRQRRRYGASSGFLRLVEMKASSRPAPVEISPYTGKLPADNRQIHLNKEKIPNMRFLLNYFFMHVGCYFCNFSTDSPPSTLSHNWQLLCSFSLSNNLSFTRCAQKPLSFR